VQGASSSTLTSRHLHLFRLAPLLQTEQLWEEVLPWLLLNWQLLPPVLVGAAAALAAAAVAAEPDGVGRQLLLQPGLAAAALELAAVAVKQTACHCCVWQRSGGSSWSSWCYAATHSWCSSWSCQHLPVTAVLQYLHCCLACAALQSSVVRPLLAAYCSCSMPLRWQAQLLLLYSCWHWQQCRPQPEAACCHSPASVQAVLSELPAVLTDVLNAIGPQLEVLPRAVPAPAAPAPATVERRASVLTGELLPLVTSDQQLQSVVATEAAGAGAGSCCRHHGRHRPAARQAPAAGTCCCSSCSLLLLLLLLQGPALLATGYWRLQPAACCTRQLPSSFSWC